MKGIILHGGHGTRLRPLTHTGPKQLLPIANKPMSEYCLDSIKETGITEIAIIIGGIGSNKVEEYYGNGERFGVNITYIVQDEPRGIAHAIKLCKDFIGNDKFIVFLGDNIIQKSIYDFANNFQNSKFDASILLCEVDNPSRFGIADIKNDRIVKIMEKPKVPPTNYAVTGIYMLTPKIFDIINDLKPSKRNELEITDALDLLLKENNNINFDMITDYWKDTGTPDDIINANSQILEQLKPEIQGKIDNNANVKGNIILGKNSEVKADAEIIGPVIIGENCTIESNSKIGPNASIGNDSIISKCSINNSIIMNNCKLIGKYNIGNSIISANSEIMQKDEESDNKVFLLGEGTKISL
tara:strand:+ start:1626 stop:2693 length:1068 start_codon:yes stop_codon:yes gene_type:complete